MPSCRLSCVPLCHSQLGNMWWITSCFYIQLYDFCNMGIHLFIYLFSPRLYSFYLLWLFYLPTGCQVQLTYCVSKHPKRSQSFGSNSVGSYSQLLRVSSCRDFLRWIVQMQQWCVPECSVKALATQCVNYRNFQTRSVVITYVRGIFIFSFLETISGCTECICSFFCNTVKKWSYSEMS